MSASILSSTAARHLEADGSFGLRTYWCYDHVLRDYILDREGKAYRFNGRLLGHDILCCSQIVICLP